MVLLRRYRCAFEGCETAHANKRNNMERHVWTRHVRDLLKFQSHVRYIANYHKVHVDKFVKPIVVDVPQSEADKEQSLRRWRKLSGDSNSDQLSASDSEESLELTVAKSLTSLSREPVQHSASSSTAPTHRVSDVSSQSTAHFYPSSPESDWSYGDQRRSPHWDTSYQKHRYLPYPHPPSQVQNRHLVSHNVERAVWRPW